MNGVSQQEPVLLTQVSSYSVIELINHHKQESFDKEVFGNTGKGGFNPFSGIAFQVRYPGCLLSCSSAFDAVSTALLALPPLQRGKSYRQQHCKFPPPCSKSHLIESLWCMRCTGKKAGFYRHTSHGTALLSVVYSGSIQG